MDEQYQALVDSVSDYLHGDARDQVAQSLAGAGDKLAETMASITYQVVTQVAEQASGEMDLEIDMLLGVATETIDFLIEIAQAVGAPVGDLDDLRGRVLMLTVQAHMAKVQDDPEEVAAAKELLAQMMEDGTFDQGMAYVNSKIQAEGLDPANIQAQGVRMAQPQPDPLAAGVRQGLMGA